MEPSQVIEDAVEQVLYRGTIDHDLDDAITDWSIAVDQRAAVVVATDRARPRGRRVVPDRNRRRRRHGRAVGRRTRRPCRRRALRRHLQADPARRTPATRRPTGHRVGHRPCADHPGDPRPGAVAHRVGRPPPRTRRPRRSRRRRPQRRRPDPAPSRRRGAPSPATPTSSSSSAPPAPARPPHSAPPSSTSEPTAAPCSASPRRPPAPRCWRRRPVSPPTRSTSCSSSTRLNRPPDHRYDLPVGATVIVDEAGMLPTEKLAETGRPRRHARLATRARRRPAPVLRRRPRRHVRRCWSTPSARSNSTEVHRFANDWEREASLRLRRGDVSVAEVYDAHDRLHAGTIPEMERAAARLLARTAPGRQARAADDPDQRSDRTSQRTMPTPPHPRRGDRRRRPLGRRRRLPALRR